MNTKYEPQFWAQAYDPKYCSKNTFLKHYPQKVMLSLTSRCNLCCWHCEKSVQPCVEEDMPQELMEYIVQNILVHCRYLRIGGQ
ncbi:MAG: hypothetical protein PHV55_03510, partial [Candidatus Omnitrophica bacterium]|nr:hypothetical protein [Candidatus Omnitrophota bacterium]